jgi:hypothetical protein
MTLQVSALYSADSFPNNKSTIKEISFENSLPKSCDLLRCRKRIENAEDLQT